MADVEYGSLVQDKTSKGPMERKWQFGLVFREAEFSGAFHPPFMAPEISRGAIGEFVGMFFFLFQSITIARFAPFDEERTGSILSIAFGFGLSIFVLVYLLAEVSGANLNPAVSIGLLVGKRISLERFVVYLVAQLLGAVAGASLATIYLEDTGGGFNHLAPGILPRQAFIGEVFATALLVLSVMAATDGELARKNGHIPALLPLAIGFTVLLAHLVLIPIDGCSINPARTFASSVTNNNWDDHWVFWAGPMLGGVLATLLWEAVLRPLQPVLR